MKSGTGRVARLDETNIAYRILVGKPLRKRPRENFRKWMRK